MSQRKIEARKSDYKGRKITINEAIETEDGRVIFQGELSPEEVKLVIGVGLNWLMKEGALPMIVHNEEDAAALQMPTDTVQ